MLTAHGVFNSKQRTSDVQVVSMATGDFPGFVDVQVNGYRGVDFSSPDLTAEECAQGCRWYLAESGCVGFLPTVITSEEAVYRKVLPIFAALARSPEFSGRILGVHLEGPFISSHPGACGAHKVACIRAPDLAFMDTLITLCEGTLKIITLAAELPGSVDLVRSCVDRGICVALGHQMAEEADIQKCSDAGATLATHLGTGAR